MAMMKCKECGKDVSSKADKCPHCGIPIQKKSRTFLLFFLIASFLLIVYAQMSEPPTKLSSEGESKKYKLLSSRKLDTGGGVKKTQ